MNKLIGLILLLFLVAACKTPEARKPVSHSSGSYIDVSIARNKELNKADEAAIKELMAANPQYEYFTSNKGFWYYYNVKDTTALPTAETGDLVIFDYQINALDGTSIVTKNELGPQTYQIEQSNQDLISGLKDGLKLMKEGETVTFLLPSHKAFGYYGYEDKIGSNLPIQTRVTLNDIKQSNTEN
ncbi:gliding motility-associated peptidyl-prolyl isomerase GldI [Leeuwenhoekiella marinoflava]|uniref:Peptidyl-prolyl cis-trans isomerase n=2 Tax=Leeuwenhoekiella marinoflava TaxID=988 RepID=A0A4Q0PPJ9_9FLAO|nr:gliding motility-associated peptidyl-prolyl isomerase GldI [Leeuwenhoekiella marinoflava]RXG32506.1 protein involved in gliding motility GldI [Leeuwenhoekiella marinoflava]SHE69223.1 protein involved in gliding motility GldI [Leeuwenhoekiella marinoflava DSM 3653]